MGHVMASRPAMRHKPPLTVTGAGWDRWYPVDDGMRSDLKYSSTAVSCAELGEVIAGFGGGAIWGHGGYG